MIYMVFHRHSAEMCPGGTVRPDKEFMRKLNTQIKESGAKFIDGYIDAPGHEFYLVIDADNNTQLNNAIEQLRLVGDTNRITPILQLSQAEEWARNIGIQK